MFVALYFLLPLDLVTDAPVVTLVIALLLLVGVTTWEVRAITRAAYPRVRATQSLAVTGSLYLLVFAITYFVMAGTEPDTFGAQGLTRLDTLYFTVTIFTTVGFGDISPSSPPARLVVMVQMLLNLLVLGAGIQVLLGAVRRGQEGRAPVSDPDS